MQKRHCNRASCTPHFRSSISWVPLKIQNAKLGKRGFIRYADSSTKRDEFGSNISAAWLVPSNAVINAFAAKIARFVPNPKGNHIFSSIMGDHPVL
jgi:hypothetical protein